MMHCASRDVEHDCGLRPAGRLGAFFENAVIFPFREVAVPLFTSGVTNLFTVAGHFVSYR